MIHRLHDTDAVEMLARSFPRESAISVVDVGAHTGKFAARVLQVFPNASVIAFEPASEPFDQLSAWAHDRPGVSCVRAALGSTQGSAALNKTANAMLASILEPTARSGGISSGAAVIQDVEQIQQTTLDAALAELGVDRVDVLKLDVQGYEIEVLKGASIALESIPAVYAEAHIEQLYHGAATFTDIDGHLRRTGHRLHQIHEVTVQGDDLQTTCLDGLWLDQHTLKGLRENPLERVSPPWATRFMHTLDRCRIQGFGRVALYGAGTHTRSITPWLDANLDVEVIAVIDDDERVQGQTIESRPIVGPDELESTGAQALILSSDYFEDELWAKTESLRQRGFPVLKIYGTTPESH